MSLLTPPVVLYRYDASPFSVKIDHVLLLKNIPHHKVDVSPILPRPEITDFLGISYRRIPILAIGNDVYCDTSLIVSALERRFPVSAGYGTIFPCGKHGAGTDTGLVKIISKFYADNVLFPIAPCLLPWERFPASVVEDRRSLGIPVNIQGIVASRDRSLTMLSSHLSLLEEQMNDGREWLFDTELPGLADISIHFIFNWIQGLRPAKPLFDTAKFPLTLKWLTHISDFLKKKQRSQIPPQIISGDQAATRIMSSTFEPYNVVGFNTTEGDRLTLKVNDTIQIAPDDTGKNHPTTGKLVALNSEEFVIEVHGSRGILRCHFPRIGFTVKPLGQNKL